VLVDDSLLVSAAFEKVYDRVETASGSTVSELANSKVSVETAEGYYALLDGDELKLGGDVGFHVYAP
jgi:hypothetical protein